MMKTALSLLGLATLAVACSSTPKTDNTKTAKAGYHTETTTPINPVPGPTPNTPPRRPPAQCDQLITSCGNDANGDGFVVFNPNGDQVKLGVGGDTTPGAWVICGNTVGVNVWCTTGACANPLRGRSGDACRIDGSICVGGSPAGAATDPLGSCLSLLLQEGDSCFAQSTGTALNGNCPPTGTSQVCGGGGGGEPEACYHQPATTEEQDPAESYTFGCCEVNPSDCCAGVTCE
jgi:hypothetical protein